MDPEFFFEQHGFGGDFIGDTFTLNIDDLPKPDPPIFTRTTPMRTNIFHNANQSQRQDDQDSYNFESPAFSSRKRATEEEIYYEDEEEQAHKDAPLEEQSPLQPSSEDAELENKERESSPFQEQTASQQEKKGKKKVYIRKERTQPVFKQNKYKSKNLMSFLWTKTVNYLEDIGQMSGFDWWGSLKKKTGSREAFNKLFRMEDAQKYVRQMFEERHIHREVMLSSIDGGKKKLYIKYVRRIWDSYEKYKSITWIN